ncbi:Spore germination protein OS=Ureibacillus acetophenoni OX=614649 GN=SAMN05877842_1194 PE=3 SV=1 [Ureibacillus acetophenoni]
MSRYYYYLIIVNMVTNIIASVPVILTQHRTDGAIISMLLAIVIGVLVIYLVTKFFISVPGKTLPDLLKQTMPKWFTVVFTLALVAVWFVAGLITLLTFTILLIRFLTPEMSLVMGTVMILLFVTLGCFMKADKVMYTVEIIFLLTLPVILFIFFKAYTSEYMEWDYVKVALTFINKGPSLLPTTASFFAFLGVLNLITFNQLFTIKQKFGWKQAIFITIIGFSVLFTTYFIPIGLNGFENIESTMYPWVTSANALRLRYGIIERVVFLFLLFYLAMAVVSLLIHWHVTIELLKSVFNFNKLKIMNIRITPLIVIAIFSILTICSIIYLDEFELYQYTGYYYIILGFLIPSMLVVFWMIKRRLKQHEKKA